MAQGLKVWQVSSDINNKINGDNHEVDENDDNAFTYKYI